MDEDVDTRKEAFLNESSRSRHLIWEAAAEQGVDPAPLFGEMVESVVPEYDAEAIRFPSFEQLFSWSPDLRKMIPPLTRTLELIRGRPHCCDRLHPDHHGLRLLRSFSSSL